MPKDLSNILKKPGSKEVIPSWVPDQVPQNIRQSMSSLPNDSQFPLQPQENQSSMVKEKKKAVKKHVCPEQGCPKSITGYTQSHNLKDHMRKKHNSI